MASAYAPLAQATPVGYGVAPASAAAVVVVGAVPRRVGGNYVELYGGELFSCGDHVGESCFACFCMPGATGNIAGYGAGSALEGQDEDGCACLQHCLGQFLCPFLWPCWGASARGLLEARLALEHGAARPPSSCCRCLGDVLLHLLCGCCATAQSLRAIHRYKRTLAQAGRAPRAPVMYR
jgi:hypothetical protein